MLKLRDEMFYHSSIHSFIHSSVWYSPHHMHSSTGCKPNIASIWILLKVPLPSSTNTLCNSSKLKWYHVFMGSYEKSYFHSHHLFSLQLQLQLQLHLKLEIRTKMIVPLPLLLLEWLRINKASRYQSSMLGSCTSECNAALPFL